MADFDKIFLSTLSLRRATTLPITSNVVIRISIHALLAESDDPGKRSILYTLQISIHALLAESDIHICQIAARTDYFYPRSPCGERRYNSGLRAYFHHISIHALLAESDIGNVDVPTWIYGFLSTLSLRRATPWFTPHFRADGFLSTLSLRRATPRHFIMFFIQHISIHALLAESDPSNFASLR